MITIMNTWSCNRNRLL